MIIGQTRLLELLTAVASDAEGILFPDFQRIAFPDAKSLRSGRLMMSELRRRGLVESRGVRTVLSPKGLAILRGEPEPVEAPLQLVQPVDQTLSAHQKELLNRAAHAGVRPPPPPRLPWKLASDGYEWARGVDDSWWSRLPDGSCPPRHRTEDGFCFELVGDRHVRPRLLDSWFLPIDEAGEAIEPDPVPLTPPPDFVLYPQGSQPVSPWAQAPDGRWWSFNAVSGTWWTIENGVAVPALDAQGRPISA